jgi:hypothetical protein
MTSFSYPALKERNQDSALRKQRKQLKKIADTKKIGYLFTCHCANPNCEETLDFIYDTRKSEREAKNAAGWMHFKAAKGFLCPSCAEIQMIRNLYRNHRIEYFKAKGEYMNRMFPRDDTLA